jgi:hypothetical protein
MRLTNLNQAMCQGLERGSSSPSERPLLPKGATSVSPFATSGGHSKRATQRRPICLRRREVSPTGCKQACKPSSFTPLVPGRLIRGPQTEPSKSSVFRFSRTERGPTRCADCTVPIECVASGMAGPTAYCEERSCGGVEGLVSPNRRARAMNLRLATRPNRRCHLRGSEAGVVPRAPACSLPWIGPMWARQSTPSLVDLQRN